MDHYLIPVRVDVVSDDKTIRIVETILWDPHCWIVPLTPPIQESLERNVVEMAHTLLSDLEVQGMGRTVRHFTGRVDLYSSRLQTKIENQLRPQLWQIALSQTTTTMIRNRNKSPTKSTVPIRINLSTHGVLVKEDIVWDVSVPDFTPLDFAQTMGKDLNLPEEAVIAVAITIVEQLLGVPIDSSVDKSASPSSSGGGGETTTPVRGASLVDQRENISNVAQLVVQHRPM